MSQTNSVAGRGFMLGLVTAYHFHPESKQQRRAEFSTLEKSKAATSRRTPKQRLISRQVVQNAVSKKYRRTGRELCSSHAQFDVDR
jgi:hypothetical protein